jgi:mRNA interferase MazF
MVCCSLTTQIKEYPFEVVLDGTTLTAVLADQVKTVDWHSRKAILVGRARAEEMAEVRAKIHALIG